MRLICMFFMLFYFCNMVKRALRLIMMNVNKRRNYTYKVKEPLAKTLVC